MVQILTCIHILLVEFEKCCQCCVLPTVKSPLFIAISIAYILLQREVNCKPDDDVAFVMHLVLHDSENCLVWSNVAYIEMLQNLIMVEIILSNFDMCSIIALVDILENVLHTPDSCANLHIHMAIELHE